MILNETNKPRGLVSFGAEEILLNSWIGEELTEFHFKGNPKAKIALMEFVVKLVNIELEEKSKDIMALEKFKMSIIATI